MGINEEKLGYVNLDVVAPEREVSFTEVKVTCSSLKLYSMVIMFVFMDLNESVLVHWLVSLIAIFTEAHVPSGERGWLGLASFIMLSRFLVAPFQEKYYLQWLGHRKTYLYLSYAFLAALYFLGSFFVEDWVQARKTYTILGFSSFACLLMMFNLNSIMTLKTDIFGQNFGAISASHSISWKIGGLLGANIFTALNSPSICKRLLGLDHAVLSHSGFFICLTVLNLICIFALFWIRERKAIDPNTIIVLNVMKPIRTILASPYHLRLLLWVVISTFPIMVMKSSSLQYFIRKGAPRADMVFWSFVHIIGELLAPLFFMRYSNSPGLSKKHVIATIASMAFEMVNLPNYLTFRDHDSSQFSRVMSIFLTIQLLDALCPWLLFSNAMLIRGCSQKYKMTYLSNMFCMVNGARVGIATLILRYIDYLPMWVMFLAMGSILVLGAIFGRVHGDFMDDTEIKDAVAMFDDQIEK